MKTSWITILILFVISVSASNDRSLAQTAQEAHVSGSPNPVGSGARALGMGGAFIGVADDATAASWNPGGLIQLETPEMSLVLSYDRLSEKRDFLQNPGASGQYGVNLLDLNYLSAAYPFTWFDRNMIVSLNYQTLYNFNKTHDYTYKYRSLTQSHVESTLSLPGATILMVRDTTIDMFGPRITNLETEGYLKALSPAFAVQLTPTFSLGFALNWFHPSLGSKWNTSYNDKFNGNLNLDSTIVTTRTPPPPPPITTVSSNTYSVNSQTRYRDEFRFRSSLNPLDIFSRKTSYTVGFLWSISPIFTLGGVYKAPFKATVNYKEVFSNVQDMVNINDPTDATHIETPMTTIANEKQEMDMPESYGLGLAARFSDQFTLDLDIYRTNWQDFVLRQANGRELSLITGQERDKADTKPTHQVRLGGEYLLYPKERYVVPLRAGVFYDPEPTENRPDTFYGFSLGGGIAVGAWVFDLAYQYRWGNGVRKVRLGQEEIYQDVKQHTIYISFIYHF